MAFESLACRYQFELPDFPERWIPLIHLYDPDLPLFPIYYFHVLPEVLPRNHRPRDDERAFGYVEKVNISSVNTAEVTIVCNKDLSQSTNSAYRNLVLNEIKERFGIRNPVTAADVQAVFVPPLDESNRILPEIWERVVSNAYGNLLPFGRLWDPSFGLARFVASWNSQSGRKGELIQTHYFVSRFGARIQSSGQVPQVDFYLLPTIKELTNPNNPLVSFPKYSKLVRIAHNFQEHFCSTVHIDGITLSKFRNPFRGNFNTNGIMAVLRDTCIPQDCRELAIECFNAFGKGPQRTVIFLMLLDDLRKRRLDPSVLTSPQCGSIYDGLGGTYQSPKSIQIYAQQSFGNPSAMPFDTWMQTFFRWPLSVWPTERRRDKYQFIFSHSQNLGRVERLLWVTAQARKVHSSACNNALWCIKKSSNEKPRGANPLSCNICLDAIRNVCPAFERIRNDTIVFNPQNPPDAGFTIATSAGDNTTPNQTFCYCRGHSIYSEILDDFSPADDPEGFGHFPTAQHRGMPITVEEFVRIY